MTQLLSLSQPLIFQMLLQPQKNGTFLTLQQQTTLKVASLASCGGRLGKRATQNRIQQLPLPMGIRDDIYHSFILNRFESDYNRYYRRHRHYRHIKILGAVVYCIMMIMCLIFIFWTIFSMTLLKEPPTWWDNFRKTQCLLQTASPTFPCKMKMKTRS